MADNDNNSDMPIDPDSESSEDLTQAKLQEKLRLYQQAYKEEFELAEKEHPEQTIENTLDYFKKNVPMACAQIVWLMENSTSDATRLAAGKYVIDRVFKGMVDSPEDPVRDILAALMKGEDEPATAK